MLLSGFEPESKPRKGLMIGRYTTGADFSPITPRGFLPPSLVPRASMIDHYTTGLTINSSVIGPGLELSYITLARKKLSPFKPDETINLPEKYQNNHGNYSIKRGF
jgi:hypothetical protein